MANLLRGVPTLVSDAARRLTQGERREGDLLPIADLIDGDRARTEARIRSLCRTVPVADGTTLCRVLGRYKLYADTRDIGLSSHLMMDGYWEMWTTEAIATLVRPGMRVADIGANLGYFTILMADLVGPAGHVFAFEPNPDVAQRLRDTVMVNGFASRATIHEVALSDGEGSVALAVPHRDPKNATIMAEPSLAGHKVAMRRMEAIPDLHDLDFLKIDVEGAEERVWRGMAGILAIDRPMTIVLEFASIRYPDAGAFIDDIMRYGFALARIDLERGIEPITREALLRLPADEDQLLVLRR